MPPKKRKSIPTHKFCCDPFEVHKVNFKKNLRKISSQLKQNYPELLSDPKSTVICDSCRKKLYALNQGNESENTISHDITTAEVSQKEGSSDLDSFLMKALMVVLVFRLLIKMMFLITRPL